MTPPFTCHRVVPEWQPSIGCGSGAAFPASLPALVV